MVDKKTLAGLEAAVAAGRAVFKKRDHIAAAEATAAALAGAADRFAAEAFPAAIDALAQPLAEAQRAFAAAAVFGDRHPLPPATISGGGAAPPAWAAAYLESAGLLQALRWM